MKITNANPTNANPTNADPMKGNPGSVSWQLLLVIWVALAPSQLLAQNEHQTRPNPAGPENSAGVQSYRVLTAATIGQYSFGKHEFDKHGGIEYHSGDDFRLTLDAYVPTGAGPFPAILAVHGGAWRSGTKLHWFRHARKFARYGYTVIVINYRHAPRYQFPAQIHDCKRAVRWMRINSGKYKIDPQRIAGMGYSAGGHLVALLGTTAPGDGLEGDVPENQKNISTRLQAVVAGGAPCEFSWIRDNALSYWMGDSKTARPELYKKASPLTYLSADDPPFMFFHGDEDSVVDMSSPQKMHQAIRNLGMQSEFIQYRGYGHISLFSDTDAFEPAIDFLNRQFNYK